MSRIRLEGALITRRKGHLVEAVLVQDPTNVNATDGVVIGCMTARVASSDEKLFREWFALMQKHLEETIRLGVKVGAFGKGVVGGDFVMSDQINLHSTENGSIPRQIVEKAKAQCEEKLADQLDALDAVKRTFRDAFKAD